MVDVLVLYGHHKKEKKFGEDVKQKYIETYGDDPEVLLIKELKGCDKEEGDVGETRVYDEIADLIDEHQGKITVDLHCPAGNFKLDEGDFYAPVSERLKQLAKDDDPKSNPYLQVRKPLKANITENESCKGLADYLLEAGEANVFNFDINDFNRYTRFVSVINSNCTSMITTESVFNVSNGNIIRDDFYKSVLERTVKFLHSLVEYTKE